MIIYIFNLSLFYVKMLCENHRPQESSQVQILDGHQEPKVLEISSSG